MPDHGYVANAAGDWDFARERRAALTRAPVVRWVPRVSMAMLSARLDADPAVHVVLSDIHGEHHLLRGALTELGMIDGTGARIARRGVVVHLGDVADGRHLADPDALRCAAAWCEVICCGNHEAAMLGAPHFAGIDFFVTDRCRPLLAELAARGQLVGAYAVGDVLLSHAGVLADASVPTGSAAAAAAHLNAALAKLVRTGERTTELCAVGPDRGGADPWGGALWCDWRTLHVAPARGYRQVVGHTPLAHPEIDADARVVCLDTAGDCVGVCLIDSAGTWWFAEYPER